MLHRVVVRHGVIATFLTLVFGVVSCSDSTSNPAGPTATASTAPANAGYLAASGTAGGVSGSTNGTAVPSSSTATGTVSVKLTDSPFSDAQALLVTFSELSLHRAEGDWQTLPFAGGSTSRMCDLKQLQGPSDVLGVGALPAGHYTQIRLTVIAAIIYPGAPSTGGPCASAIAPPAGEHWPVEVPSRVVKLNHEFTVSDGGATTILLDFDGDRSIKRTGSGSGGGNSNGGGNNGGQKNGRYIMTPVIGIVSVQ